MKKIALILVVACLAGGFAMWWFSDKQVLKRKTGSLMKTLTMDAGSGKTSRHIGAYSLNALLAPRVNLASTEIKEANGTFEREDLEAAYSWLCDASKHTLFQVNYFDSVTVSGNTAMMKLNVTGLVELQTYKPADGKYDVVFNWKKFEDGWRLENAVWSQTK